MSDNKVSVKNRSSSMVVYSVPEMGVRREFAPNEVKTVSMDELNALSYLPGGMNLIRKHLFVQDESALQEMSVKVEPEYYLDEKGVIDLLEKGPIDAFLDCLDFAPEGVLDLIKKHAVALPVNDNRKREAIKEKMGFDVTAAIKHLEEARKAEEEESGVKAEAITPVRRVKTEEAQPATGRRTAVPQYKVVTPKQEA